MSVPRYCYHNRLYGAAGSPHGIFCGPVRSEDGRCIVSRDKQLVIFGDGTTAAVIRRCPRLQAKCPQHRESS